ncbi:OmpP1/FadL family transporter [Agrobacterium larrymoorei]|uniref:Outer membrane protein transport protein n=1 Tax=Agrobacterium larrymoorei TaxID=160699 RepID=A0AAF0HDY0_9HYPH|nr:outer membrane protein transport protein [Agrobacterium larrymoorei]WHA42603.1 outer membrane protein transport protein [Agrobacterium larrymoorei]
MKIRVIRRRCALLLIAGLSSASSIPAMAGGFSRGEANTDILFDDARFSTESSLVYVSPDRSYSKLMGQSVDEGAYSDSFLIPNVAFGMRFNDNLSCAFTYTKPFGGAGTYSEAAQNAELVTAAANGDPLPNPTSRMKVSSDEYGGTCDIRVAAGPGRMHFIGGLFVESFSYREDTLIGGVRLKDDGELGYRAGIAYDIPEYALRVQLLYRSEVRHEGDGTFTASDFGTSLGIPDTLPAFGKGTLPQSIKLYAQTGVAPGWLVYGSATWTDWSVLPEFSYTVTNLGTARKVFNYKDGYTLQLGVGHDFTDKLSGTTNITWDQGVGTGADITTDTWSIGVGVQYKAQVGTFGLGAALSYLTAGKQRVTEGATYDADAKADWAAVAGVSYKLSF